MESDPKADGTADVQINSQCAGQYRLSYAVTDGERIGRWRADMCL